MRSSAFFSPDLNFGYYFRVDYIQIKVFLTFLLYLVVFFLSVMPHKTDRCVSKYLESQQLIGAVLQRANEQQQQQQQAMQQMQQSMGG